MVRIRGNESNILNFIPKDLGKPLNSQELIAILRGIFSTLATELNVIEASDF
tara:strand:- start:4183 stop:4338 length:156 start_codon:yes stop_codon:yes gene_type:complete